jgi:hypothetical protein
MGNAVPSTICDLGKRVHRTPRIREIAKWERRNRAAAVEQARRLAIALHHGTPIKVRPFGLGLALGPDETLWLDTWARCLLDALPYTTDPASLSLSRWVATDRRIVGRLATGVLTG